MEELLEKRCRLFIENKTRMEEAFKWESGSVAPVCSSLFTAKNKQLDVEAIKKSEEIIKENTDLFSEFRGYVKLALAAFMTLKSNPKEYLLKVKKVYELLTENKWVGSEHLLITATIICDNDKVVSGEITPEEAIEKTREMYEKMKENHPFLTADEDSGFAALLALSDVPSQVLISEMEICYKKLKVKFKRASNTIQAVSHVLAASSLDNEYKCQRVCNLFDMLRNKKIKTSGGYEMAAMACLALLPEKLETLAQEIGEVENFLKEQKGFGNLGMGSAQRLMYADILVMQYHLLDIKDKEEAANNSDENVSNTDLSKMISITMAETAAMKVALTSAVVLAGTSNQI